MSPERTPCERWNEIAERLEAAAPETFTAILEIAELAARNLMDAKRRAPGAR